MNTAREVPAGLVVDFNFYRPGVEGLDPFTAFTRRLHGKPPVVWSPHNGGHWIVTTGKASKEVLTDPDRFSSESVFIPRVDRPRTVPLEYDPPEHTAMRRAIRGTFLPAPVKIMATEARNLAIELIEAFKPRGGCEFVSEFGQQLPIIIWLKMMNLPMDDRPDLLEAVNAGIRPRDEAHREWGRAYMGAYIDVLVDDRMANPGDDPLSLSLQEDIGGRRMNRSEAVGLATTLLGGGLDTVATTLAWFALHLAENPADRALLRAEPERIPKAIHELMRRYAIPNIARIVTRDMEFEGAPLRKGDAILVSACLHALDPLEFENPCAVDLTRRNAHAHLGFSAGVHHCAGAPLALSELRIFLEEWLPRIPDFRTDPDDPPVVMTGIVNGLDRLPLRWD
jgi:cytochrome P450